MGREVGWRHIPGVWEHGLGQFSSLGLLRWFSFYPVNGTRDDAYIVSGETVWGILRGLSPHNTSSDRQRKVCLRSRASALEERKARVFIVVLLLATLTEPELCAGLIQGRVWTEDRQKLMPLPH